GMYQLKDKTTDDAKHRVTLLGSGPILREAIRAQQILFEKYDVASDIWSVTSYTELRRDAQECQRWNMLHPTEEAKVPYVAEQLAAVEHPVVAASDYVQALPEQIDPWVPGGLTVLGTDGMGRSESREALRRHFEVDAECITIAALYELSRRGEIDAKVVAKAIQDLGVDPEKQSALYA
ncbi:MAG: pyruvate dehydrogenase (acetyl-transferring), homodimeric type, partial [Lacipirellulaceae bacterium]